MRLLINVEEVRLANMPMTKKRQVKLKQTLIVRIGLSVLQLPIQGTIPMRTCTPSLSRDQ